MPIRADLAAITGAVTRAVDDGLGSAARPGSGGRRDGAGRRRGFKWPRTLAKIEARERVRQFLTERLGGILEAQVANAQGIKYLVARDPKSGTFRRLTADELAGGELPPGSIEVWEKDPNVTAALGLLAYAIDRPKEQAQDVNVSGAIDIVHVLRERSARRLRGETDAVAAACDVEAIAGRLSL